MMHCKVTEYSLKMYVYLSVLFCLIVQYTFVPIARGYNSSVRETMCRTFDGRDKLPNIKHAPICFVLRPLRLNFSARIPESLCAIFAPFFPYIPAHYVRQSLRDFSRIKVEHAMHIVQMSVSTVDGCRLCPTLDLRGVCKAVTAKCLRYKH